jgi:MFS family permease
MSGYTQGTSPAGLRFLQAGVTLFFGLGGFLFAGWAVRIPAIKAQIDASLSALGLALLAMTVAAVVTMAVTGWLCSRFGDRRVLIAASLLLSIMIVPPALAGDAVELGLSLVLFGAGYGAIDVAVNSVAVDLIGQLGRPIMPALHAANSIGSLAGAGAGALLAVFLSPAAHMLVVAPLGVALTLVAGRLVTAGASRSAQTVVPAPPGDAGQRRGHGRVAAVAVFGMVGLCAAYSQGGLDGWVPLHLSATLDANQALAAVGYALVQGTIALGRLAGTGLLERAGQTRAVVIGGLLSTAGTLLTAWTPDLPLAFVGLAVTGLGLANIFPVAMARAGQVGGSHGVAAAATLGYGGIMLAPPTIGFVAAGFGLPAGLTLIATMTALAAGSTAAIAAWARMRQRQATDAGPATRPTSDAPEPARLPPGPRTPSRPPDPVERVRSPD